MPPDAPTNPTLAAPILSRKKIQETSDDPKLPSFVHWAVSVTALQHCSRSIPIKRDENIRILTGGYAIGITNNSHCTITTRRKAYGSGCYRSFLSTNWNGTVAQSIGLPLFIW